MNFTALLRFLVLLLFANGIVRADVAINEVMSAGSERALQWSSAGVASFGFGTRWTETAFGDAGWQTGAGPFGFGSFTNVSPAPTIGTNVGPQMQNLTPTLYLRKTFSVSAADAARTDPLVVDVQFNDGFACYINGVEVARLAGVPVATFRHRDADDLARLARERPRVLVMADAVGPSSGALAPVTDYLHALEGCGRALLLVDDAHGFGVLGANGRGLLDELDLWPKVNAIPAAPGVSLYASGMLAKALGGFGGIIPGTRDFVQRVRASAHYFDGASAPVSAASGGRPNHRGVAIHDHGQKLPTVSFIVATTR